MAMKRSAAWLLLGVFVGSSAQFSSGDTLDDFGENDAAAARQLVDTAADDDDSESGVVIKMETKEISSKILSSANGTSDLPVSEAEGKLALHFEDVETMTTATTTTTTTSTTTASTATTTTSSAITTLTTTTLMFNNGNTLDDFGENDAAEARQLVDTATDDDDSESKVVIKTETKETSSQIISSPNGASDLPVSEDKGKIALHFEDVETPAMTTAATTTSATTTSTTTTSTTTTSTSSVTTTHTTTTTLMLLPVQSAVVVPSRADTERYVPFPRPSQADAAEPPLNKVWVKSQAQKLKTMVKELTHEPVGNDASQAEPIHFTVAPHRESPPLRSHSPHQVAPKEYADFERMFNLGEPDAPPTPEANPKVDGSTAATDTADSDDYAMMMYYKARVESTQRENKKLHKMIKEAGEWSQAMRGKLTELDAKKKENGQLRHLVDNFQTSQFDVDAALAAEKQREFEAQKKVQALEWVRARLANAQKDNVQLQHSLDRETSQDQALELKIQENERVREDAETKTRQFAEEVRTSSSTAESMLKAYSKARLSEAVEEAETKEAQTGLSEKTLQQAIQKRDQLVKKGLEELVTEKAKEKQLMKELRRERRRGAGELKAEHQNTTTLEQQLQDQTQRLASLRKAVAKAFRRARDSAKDLKRTEDSTDELTSELHSAEVNRVQSKNKAAFLSAQIEREKSAAARATKQEELSDKARDAAQAELKKAQNELQTLRRGHNAMQQAKNKIMAALQHTKAEEAELYREEMRTVSDGGGLNLSDLDTPADGDEKAPDAAVSEPSPVDMASVDIVA